MGHLYWILTGPSFAVQDSKRHFCFFEISREPGIVFVWLNFLATIGLFRVKDP
jgi:hypothetical protein